MRRWSSPGFPIWSPARSRAQFTSVEREAWAEKPRSLFTLASAPLDLDVTRTGFVTTALPAVPRSANVILGWERELETLVPHR